MILDPSVSVGVHGAENALRILPPSVRAGLATPSSPASILQRLRHVLARDVAPPGQVRDRARHPQHAVVGARGQAQAGDRGGQEWPCVLADRAVAVKTRHVQARVAFSAVNSSSLNFTARRPG